MISDSVQRTVLHVFCRIFNPMNLNRRLSCLSPAVTYGLLNALVGLIVAFYVFTQAIGDGYEVLMIAAPLGMFCVGALLWKAAMKNEKIEAGRIIFLGILVGIIAHYLTWIFASIFMNLCYWCFGGCTDSFGDAPESIPGMFAFGIVLSFFSILFVGWMTVAGSILCGVVMWWIEKRKRSGQE